MEEPGVLDGWTLKDLLAHIAGWERLVAADARAVTRGEPFRPDGAAAEPVDQINARLVAAAREVTADEVIAEARASYPALLATIEELSDADLAIRGRYPWSADEMVANFVADSSFLHYREHLPEIRAWIGRWRAG
jgi:hypothetical protein